MTAAMHDWSLADLKRTWQSESESPSRREHAFWHYWRLRAEESSLDEESWVELLASESRVLPDVIGHLATMRAIPSSRSREARDRMVRSAEPSARWAEAQLRALECLRRIERRDSDASVCLEGLTEKGTSWAATAALSSLSNEKACRLVAVAEEKRCFTKSQIAQLRRLLNRRRRPR